MWRPTLILACGSHLLLHVVTSFATLPAEGRHHALHAKLLGLPPHELDKTSGGQVLTAAGHLQRAGARFRKVQNVQKKCEEIWRINNSKSSSPWKNRSGPGLSQGELEPMVVHCLFWMLLRARCCISWHTDAWFGVREITRRSNKSNRNSWGDRI